MHIQTGDYKRLEPRGDTNTAESIFRRKNSKPVTSRENTLLFPSNCPLYCLQYYHFRVLHRLFGQNLSEGVTSQNVAWLLSTVQNGGNDVQI